MELESKYQEMSNEKLFKKYEDLLFFTELEQKIIIREREKRLVCLKVKNGNNEKTKPLTGMRKIFGWIFVLFLLSIIINGFINYFNGFYKNIEVNSFVKILPYTFLISIVLFIILRLIFGKIWDVFLIDFICINLFFMIILPDGLLMNINNFHEKREVIFKGRVTRFYSHYRKGSCIEISNSNSKLNIYLNRKRNYQISNKVSNFKDAYIEIEIKEGIFGVFFNPKILKIENKNIRIKF